MRTFILLIPRCPIWKSFKVFFVTTACTTTRSTYINMPLHVENILVLTFWFINSFLIWFMNLSNFVFNFISTSVTGSSLTVLNKTFLTSIAELNKTMTIYSSVSVLFGINLDNPFACVISYDGKNFILNK